MRCYICNKETDRTKTDPNGKTVYICHQCYKSIYHYYKDIELEDIKLLKEIKDDCRRTDKETASVSS